MVESNKSRPKEGKSKKPKGVAIDSNQLLSLCQRMRENMGLLEKSIQLTKLKLITLAYVNSIEGNNNYNNRYSSCFDQLIELCNLSQQVVGLLEQLHSKLSESSENSIQYQIASQQLMYYTSEWYDNYTPKLNETFELAYNQDLIYRDGPSGRRNREEIRLSQALDNQDNSARAIDNNLNDGGSPGRTVDALMRLRESMMENERLIAAIATNIEYTRATIDTIQESLQSTKLNLYMGETNAIEAVKTLRESRYYKFLCYLMLAGVFSIVALIVLHLIGLI